MRIIVLVTVVLLSACSALPPLPEWQGPEGRDHTDLGLIVDLRNDAVLTPAQLIARLQDSEALLVGERHDNPDHHALQLWLLQALEQQRPQGSLLLEMLEPGQQARVDSVRRDLRAGHAPGDLAQALDWQKGWDWNLYGPLVSHALMQSYPLLQANLGRDEIMSIYRAAPRCRGALRQRPR